MAGSVATIPRTQQIRFDRPDQVRAAVIGVTFIAVFWNLFDFIPPLGSLTHAWVNELDWSHGPLIPVFSAYLVYLRWDRLRRIPIRYAWVGLVILVFGLGAYIVSQLGFVPFGYAQPLAMMVTLFGVIVALCGVPALWHLWLPWMYLFLAIPLPQRVYFELTNPLRRLAAEVASMIMGLVPGLQAERVGSNLEFWYQGARHQIGVADACSGMRSTVTLCAVGVAVAFLTDRPWWQRLILVAGCIPIATFCNLVRVTVTCWLTVFVDPKYAHGTYHTMLGLLVILLAFAIFSGLAWVLDHIFVPDDDDVAPEAEPE